MPATVEAPLEENKLLRARVRELEAALQDSESRLRVFIEHAPGGIAMFDREMRYLVASRRWIADHGLKGDPAGRTVYELQKDFPEHWREAHRRGLAGEVLSMESDSFSHNDGSTRWVTWEIHPWRLADGQVGGVVIAAEAVTEQVLNREALRKREAHYRLVVETMLQGVVHRDAEGKIIAMNPAAERILGRSREEYIGSDAVREQHRTIRENGECFPGLEHPSMVALRTGQKQENVIMGVFNPILADYRWISIDAVPVFRPGDSHPYEVFTVFEDITLRHNTERTLRQSEQFTRSRWAEAEAALDALPANIAILDAHGVILRVNAAWKDFAHANGLPPGGAGVGMNYLELCDATPDADELLARQFGAGIRRVIRGEDDARFSMEYPCHSQHTQRWFMGYVTAIAGDGPARVVVAHVDVTIQKRAEEQIRVLNDDLESRVVERTMELRTAVDSLEKEILQRERLEREILEISERETARVGQDLHDGLCQTLTGIAFMARLLQRNLEAEKLTCAAAALDAEKIVNLIRDATHEARGLAMGMYPVNVEEHGLSVALERFAEDTAQRFHIQCRFRCATPITLADSRAAIHLYRISQEAVCNAIRHGRAETVLIDLAAHDGQLILTIQDDGIGMLKDWQPTGMGLKTMSYRARLIGGALDIRQRAHGIKVICSFPNEAMPVT